MSSATSANFYRQFEDRFRTSRQNIKQRLLVYQPLLTFLRTQQPQQTSLHALDLGCGRGEWLEVLLEAGFNAQGIDLDAGMLEACHELGLPATEGDAIADLKKRPDNSLSLVSAFHMVEHITFDMLLTLVEEALRVLAPGGILLMETPNPENLSVGTSSFYLDPTHSKPIPHALLAFVTEHKGFAAHQILRVNEPYTPHPDDPVLLNDVLFNVSPDYAVVAIKESTPEIMAQFQSVMSTPSGMSLDQAAYQYDEQIAKRLQQLEQTLARTRHHANKLYGYIVQTQAVNQRLEQRILDLERQQQPTQPAGLSRSLGRIPRILKRLYRGLTTHGIRGLWLPLSEYLNASPRRRNAALRRLRRWNLPRVAAALFNESAIRARIATHHKPEQVLALPPSAQAIDTMVLSELYTHIEE